jgi:hypothetical protein
MPITFDAEAFVDGRRSATLAPATHSDRARLTPDGGWLGIDDIEIGTQIHEVNHFGRHTTTHGTVMHMESIVSRRIFPLMVTDIHLVRCSDLTPDELAELGHADRASFDAEFGESLGDRRAWLIRVIPVEESDLQ